MSASERRIAELERQVAALDVKNAELQHLLKRQLQTGETLWFESGVSSRTGEPFVHIRWGDESGQLSVEEAREHALHMLEVVNAAEFDAAFVKAMTNPAVFGDERVGGLPLEEALRLLALIRQAREGGDKDASLASPQD
jgi:hypothetical protein